MRTTISCHPIVWEQILVFFLLNYGAHAATTISIPGAKWWANAQWQIVAFCFPFAGLGRAIGLLISHRRHGEDELGKAIAMGAVAVVGRSKDWQPCTREGGGDELVYVQLPDGFNEAIDSEMSTVEIVVNVPDRNFGPISGIKSFPKDHESLFNIHGQFASLPDGYELVICPPGQLVELAIGLDNRSEIRISRSRSFLKMATSIVQLILSSVTIYRTRGSQLDRYGYAAFGLSVFPYAFMSLVNLICIGIVGDYPSIYVMRTPLLDEVEGRDGTRISGEVGTLKKIVNGGRYERVGGWMGERGFRAVRMWKEMGNGEDIIAVQVDKAKPPTKFKLAETARDKIVVNHINHGRRHRPITLSSEPLFLAEILVELLENIPTRIRQRSATSKHRRLTNLRLWIKELVILFFIFASPILALVLPHLLIFFLTGFKKRESTAVERGFMMSWLVVSQAYGLWFSFVIVSLDPTFFIPFPQMSVLKTLDMFFRLVIVAPLFLASPIGGFVMVGKMLREFGSCSLIP
ncbi:hypothetical protein PILCRDRAFT_2159 [Piloderma croceum F 1598]|uniref:Uncharacterized protein n=1 Tax=Piloderma croceum (strain F 1598) TaxID=765440 RepID=A0A0C3GGX3_PILCF|nr:hypothetical protein PILCRDRAFT_2159 [Piloderma croceum F 1598]